MTGGRPWWLWPNLLSLDAPLVAVVWQLFLAADAGVEVPPAAAVVLGLVVWGVYLADRALDAAGGCAGSDRHRFAAAHRPIQVSVAALAFLVAGVIAFTLLPSNYLSTGAVVSAVLGAYLLAIHAGRRWLGAGAKELSVGITFAAGVSIPLAAQSGSPHYWLPAVVAFAGLCALNCLLIAVWEGEATPRWAFALAALALVAAAGASAAVAAAIGLSAATLGLLHGARARVSPRAARVLADAVLLTPFPVAVLL